MKKTILALFFFISLAAAGQQKDSIKTKPPAADSVYVLQSANINDFVLLRLALQSNNRKVTPEELDALIEWIEKRLKKVATKKEQPK